MALPPNFENWVPPTSCTAMGTRSSRTVTGRHHDDGTIHPPGLWQLHRHCRTGGDRVSDGLHIEAPGVEQDVVIFASVPLTAEGWVPLSRGEVLVATPGQLAAWCTV